MLTTCTVLGNNKIHLATLSDTFSSVEGQQPLLFLLTADAAI